jgi:hypothetical protein
MQVASGLVHGSGWRRLESVVFDNVSRSYLGPREHGESQFAYLNRSARPQFQAARRRVDEWFSRLCPGLKGSVLRRLRSGDDQEFDAGFWELYLHELFTQLGYEIACEPRLPNGRKIDFLLRRGGAGVYLEATTAGKSDDQRGADTRRDRIYRGLNQVQTSAFMIGVSIDHAGNSDMPRLATLRAKLQEWLDGLDPDEAQRQWETAGEVPTYRWDDNGGWELTFEAFPNKPELRGQLVERPLGMFFDSTSGGLIKDEDPLRRALKRKQPSRYGSLAWSYVVAVREMPFIPDDTDSHRTNVLFGRNAVQYGDGRDPRWVRLSDGIWRGPGARPRNRRLAAVIFASHLTPWSVDKTELEWWDNPFASLPVPDDMIPDVARRRQLRLGESGEGRLLAIEPVRTPGSVLRHRRQARRL